MSFPIELQAELTDEGFGACRRARVSARPGRKQNMRAFV